MKAFASMVRCEEQLLSKHRVLGPVLPVNEQQLFEHELSMANAEFHLSAARQSRHALWFDFQSRALVASKGEDETEDGKPLREIDRLNPSCFTNSENERVCQVLLVRPCLAGGDSGPLRIGALTRSDSKFLLFYFFLPCSARNVFNNIQHCLLRLPPRYMSGSSHPKGNRRMAGSCAQLLPSHRSSL
ncbi:unnamed protein product [Durusdinium trenchii]|uniref:Uncharacterized protein n=1 Tax=Durusdinium trenchii TaxID=1381693 RepID=A0ABP0IW34_9DINO